MRPAVELDDEAVVRVVEVDSAQKRGFISDGDLDLRSREARENKKQANASLHWAFGSWFCKLDGLSQHGDPASSTMHLGPMLDLFHADQTLVKRPIKYHDGFDQWETTTKVRDRT